MEVHELVIEMKLLERRMTFNRWKGIYETWKRRKEAYQKKLHERELTELLRFQPVY